MGKGRQQDLSDVNIITVSELVNRRFYDFYALRNYNIGLHKPLSCTLLYAAVMNGDEECVDLILPKLSSVYADKGGFFVKHHESAVHRALAYENLNILRKLIEHGASVNDTDSVEHQDQPLLHAAVEKGYYEIAKYLVEKGADVNMRGHSELCDTTPLMEAVLSGSEELVKLLLENGADPNAEHQYNDLEPMVNEAANAGKLEILKLLLDHGATVELRIDCFDLTPRKSIINNVIFTPYIDIMKHLLERFDVDLNVSSNDLACTTLHMAIIGKVNNPLMVQELLDAGSDVNSMMSQPSKLPLEMTRIGSKSTDLDTNKLPVKRHIVKLMAAGQEVHEKNAQAVDDPEFADLRQECEAELEELKGAKVGGTDVSLFDVLFGKVEKLKKAEVKKVMETLDEFPIYGRMLFYRLKKFCR